MSDWNQDEESSNEYLETAIRRVRGLLAKAEGTDNPHEAETFFAAAAKLMEKYRLDAAMIRATMGQAEEEVVGTRYPLVDRCSYLRASLTLLAHVSQHFTVRVVIGATGNSKYPSLAGTPTDIEATILMFESLLIQRDREALRYRRIPGRDLWVMDPMPDPPIAVPGTTATSFRNSFGYGYADRIGIRLKEIRTATIQHVAETGDAEAGNALAVIDRRVEKVSAFLAGKTKTNNHNKARLEAGAYGAGDEAGRRADLGQDRFENVGPRALGA